MPIYVYRCESCGRAFEKLVRSMSGAASVTCPTCGSDRVARRPAAFAAPTASRSAACVPGASG